MPSFLAIGILSQGADEAKRMAVRQAWAPGRRVNMQGFEVLSRFVACASGPGERGRLAHEGHLHEDLFVLPCSNATTGLKEAYHQYAAFAWLRKAATHWRPRFVALADDDSYVHVAAVVADLSLVSAQLQARAAWTAYGGVEWGSMDSGTYELGARGRSPEEAGRQWRRIQQTPGRQNASRPFPFLKGPLMVYGSSLAAVLTAGKHGSDEEARLRQAHTPVDALLGYILASARGGRGTEQATVVDIGDFGFREYRPSLWLEDSEARCFRVVRFGRASLERIIRQERQHQQQSASSNCTWHAGDSLEAVRARCMSALAHEHRLPHDSIVQGRAAAIVGAAASGSLTCAQSQPMLSGGVLSPEFARGWEWCLVKYGHQPGGVSGGGSSSRYRRHHRRRAVGQPD